MTVAEWTRAITDDYTTAGFAVSEYQGFPLVKVPESLEEKVRFLKFKPSMSVTITIYREGALITPYGISPAEGRAA